VKNLDHLPQANTNNRVSPDNFSSRGAGCQMRIKRKLGKEVESDCETKNAQSKTCHIVISR
jgi:hypothetical protein